MDTKIYSNEFVDKVNELKVLFTNYAEAVNRQEDTSEYLSTLRTKFVFFLSNITFEEKYFDLERGIESLKARLSR